MPTALIGRDGRGLLARLCDGYVLSASDMRWARLLTYGEALALLKSSTDAAALARAAYRIHGDREAAQDLAGKMAARNRFRTVIRRLTCCLS